MLQTLPSSRLIKSALAATIVALLAGALPASAKTLEFKNGYVQLAAEQINKPSYSTSKPRPDVRLKKTKVPPRGGTEAADGCHDDVAQQSYAGDCKRYADDDIEGCEDDNTQSSYPGPC